MRPIPLDYRLVSKNSIKASEVLAIRRSIDWTAEDSEEAWLQEINDCIEAVGVRDSDNFLVGIGFIVGNMRHAVLCDLNVRPEHQRKGIGTRIIEERLRIIKDLGIPHVYTSLAATNTLKHLYTNYGFTSNKNMYFLTISAS